MCVSMSLSVGPTVITVRPSSGESSHSAPARSSAVLAALQQSPTGLCGLAWGPPPSVRDVAGKDTCKHNRLGNRSVSG